MNNEILETAIPVSRPPGPSRCAVVWDTLQTLALAALFYAIVSLTTARVVVDGPSMRPTLLSGEWIVVNRLAYRLGQPQRGDVVVFLPPTNAQTDDLIKRVIGLPGETVEIREGAIQINGQALSEPYARGITAPGGRWELGPDQVFVMGDNRELSLDSRSFGPIPLTAILGKTLMIYWPPEEWGPLEWRSNGFSSTPASATSGGGA